MLIARQRLGVRLSSAAFFPYSSLGPSTNLLVCSGDLPRKKDTLKGGHRAAVGKLESRFPICEPPFVVHLTRVA
jgi:hypothetical protein